MFLSSYIKPRNSGGSPVSWWITRTLTIVFHSLLSPALAPPLSGIYTECRGCTTVAHVLLVGRLQINSRPTPLLGSHRRLFIRIKLHLNAADRLYHTRNSCAHVCARVYVMNEIYRHLVRFYRRKLLEALRTFKYNRLSFNLRLRVYYSIETA